MTNSSVIVSKVWNYSPALKNAGVGYAPALRGIVQIIDLLFLKLAAPSLKLRRAGSEMIVLGCYPSTPKVSGATRKPNFMKSGMSSIFSKSGDDTVFNHG